MSLSSFLSVFEKLVSGLFPKTTHQSENAKSYSKRSRYTSKSLNKLVDRIIKKKIIGFVKYKTPETKAEEVDIKKTGNQR